jgi:hypothetical protein
MAYVTAPSPLLHCEVVTPPSHFIPLTLTPDLFPGDIVPRNGRERVFVICVLVVGAAVYATVFANVTSLIGKLDAAGAKKNQSLTAINEFFSVRVAPGYFPSHLLSLPWLLPSPL